MADRYQDRPNPAHDDYGRGSDPLAGNRAESDPLAELARLIGQTDPFAMGRANAKVQPRAEQRPQVQQYQPPAEIEEGLSAARWPMANRSRSEPTVALVSALDILRLRHANPTFPATVRCGNRAPS